MMRYSGKTRRVVLAVAATILTINLFAQPMSAQLKDAVRQREENALAYHMMRDTMTANSWTNLMRLIHHLQRISSADSVIQLEYADLFTSELRNSEALKMRLDSLTTARVKGTARAGDQETPLLYIGLIIVSITLTIIGLYLVWLLWKKRVKPVLPDNEMQDELLKANQEYETKLAEISQLLAELTGEREKTALEIDELTKTLQRERQQRNTYSEHYEKLSGEHSHLKTNIETLLKENSQLKAKLDEPVKPAPEDDSLISEIEVLHAQLALANDSKNQLTSELNQALTTIGEMKSAQFKTNEAAGSDEEFTSMQKEISESQKTIKMLEDNRVTLTQELKQAHDRLKSLNDSLADARLMTGQVEALKDNFKRQTEQLTADNEMLAKEIALLKEQMTENTVDAESWNRLNQQMTTTTERLHSAEKALEQTIVALKKHESELMEVATDRDKHKELLHEKDLMNQELSVKINELSTEMQKKEKLESDLKKLLSGL